ncbi:GNAT family N-acetyltransferase [Evansella halocellulosilytica]|uniref:GNAT family N-acetyltransferase n=1 Tax=Evansella halocellulosilytica TaxID=2011013 RepID=UPI000BB7D7B5|nr:GNAT family N-acetyltransferase [Evansella halocellulosilytica]
MSRDDHIRRLNRSDKRSFVHLMVKSFEKDPLFIALFKDGEVDQKFEERACAFISFLFDKSFYLSEEIWGIYDQDKLIGAYIIEMPYMKGTQKIFDGLKLVGRVIQLLKNLSLKTIIKLNRYMKVSRSNVPKLPLYYLIMIGVTPSKQGYGVGGQLMQHIMKQVREDHRSFGIALDTENKKNISYYKRFGFCLYSETQFDDITIYGMMRK